MKSNLKILEDIMKPYFDKKAEIENRPTNEEISDKIVLDMSFIERINISAQITGLQQELENLRVRHKRAVEDYKEKMEKEIEEYINEKISSNPNLAATYGAFIRKDLEKSYNENGQIRMGYDQRLKELDDNYKDQEEALLEEIENLKILKQEKMDIDNQEVDKLTNKSDYRRVDLRELVEIKEDLRKKLFTERKILISKLKDLRPKQDDYNNTAEELREYQTKLNDIVDKLSNFKYEYNDQNQVVNNTEWKQLYEERILISNKITDLASLLDEKNSIIPEFNDVSKAIEKVEEYIKLTELTKEETAAIMMSMTPWEREEYDRRKGVSNKNTDLIQIDDDKKYKFEEKDGKIIVDDMENLLGVIFNDVVKTISNLKSVRINGSKGKLKANEAYISAKTDDKGYQEKGTVKLDESMKLPCGEYISKEDIVEATERLYSKPKDVTYIVKETGKVYKMSKDAVNKVKDALKNCTTLELVRENKLSKLDLLKVFGKKKTNDIIEQVEIGKINSEKLEDGEYINKNETIVAFKSLFTENKLEWLKKFSQNLKEKVNKFMDDLDQKEIDGFYKSDLDEKGKFLD